MTLRFGALLPPTHRPRTDPTLSLHRDLELVRRLDELGFAEAWVGEHHSGGWAPVASPELFLAAAAARTERIMLGTGAISLPYHHPLLVAARMVQLDHQTRGRVMLGVGSGGAPDDAYMLGIAPGDLSRRMAESLGAILHLLTDPTPLTLETDWFTLREAALQLRPYRRPCFDVAVAGTGSGRGLRVAARHGVHALTFAGRPGREGPSLRSLWAAGEDEAAAHGRTISRAGWRLAIVVHVAETRDQAYDEVRAGLRHWFHDYVRATLGLPADLPEGKEIETAAAAGTALVGSVEDVTDGIRRLQEDTGGFGVLLANVEGWARPEATLRSMELLAAEVAPRFTGSLDAAARSAAWVAGR